MASFVFQVLSGVQISNTTKKLNEMLQYASSHSVGEIYTQVIYVFLWLMPAILMVPYQSRAIASYVWHWRGALSMALINAWEPVETRVKYANQRISEDAWRFSQMFEQLVQTFFLSISSALAFFIVLSTVGSSISYEYFSRSLGVPIANWYGFTLSTVPATFLMAGTGLVALYFSNRGFRAGHIKTGCALGLLTLIASGYFVYGVFTEKAVMAIGASTISFFAIFLALSGTGCVLLVGRKQMEMENARLNAEGALREQLVIFEEAKNLRESFRNASELERAKIKSHKYSEALATISAPPNWLLLVSGVKCTYLSLQESYKRTSLVTQWMEVLMHLIPHLLLIPSMVSGVINIGTYFQLTAAFFAVLTSCTVIMKNWRLINEFRTVRKRLCEFIDDINDATDRINQAHKVIVFERKKRIA